MSLLFFKTNMKWKGLFPNAGDLRITSGYRTVEYQRSLSTPQGAHVVGAAMDVLPDNDVIIGFPDDVQGLNICIGFLAWLFRMVSLHECDFGRWFGGEYATDTDSSNQPGERTRMWSKVVPHTVYDARRTLHVSLAWILYAADPSFEGRSLALPEIVRPFEHDPSESEQPPYNRGSFWNREELSHCGTTSPSMKPLTKTER